MKIIAYENTVYFENGATYKMEWNTPNLREERDSLDYWENKLTARQRAIGNRQYIQWRNSTKDKIIIGP